MTLHTGLVVARPGLVRDGLQAVLSAVPGLHALEPADDGASALERLERQSLRLAILDSSLSEDESCKTLGLIKDRWPHVGCIVIASNPGQARAMQTAGADAVLVEGFAASSLSATIKEMLESLDSPSGGTDEQNERDRERTRR